MFMLTSIPLPQALCYYAAAQLLRPLLGAKAPTVTDLITMELTNRRAKSIAEEYLESHGYPTLRVCQRKLAGKRTPAVVARSRRASRTALRVLHRPLAQGDPARN
ncbi:MAG: hypothetical protein RL091_1268 [Verrucomicrobiota bacterium]|jgi:hypothetical protein